MNKLCECDEYRRPIHVIRDDDLEVWYKYDNNGNIIHYKDVMEMKLLTNIIIKIF